MQYFLSYNWWTPHWKPESSYCSSMQWAAGLQLYYVIADPKTGEQFSKCKSFQVKTDLLNSEKLKVAIAQLCYELQVCNCSML